MGEGGISIISISQAQDPCTISLYQITLLIWMTSFRICFKGQINFYKYFYDYTCTSCYEELNALGSDSRHITDMLEIQEFIVCCSSVSKIVSVNLFDLNLPWLKITRLAH